MGRKLDNICRIVTDQTNFFEPQDKRKHIIIRVISLNIVTHHTFKLNFCLMLNRILGNPFQKPEDKEITVTFAYILDTLQIWIISNTINATHGIGIIIKEFLQKLRIT